MFVMQSSYATTPKRISRRGSGIESETWPKTASTISFTLAPGLPKVISVNDTVYREIMLEADFGGHAPTISFTAFPKDNAKQELHAVYGARSGAVIGIDDGLSGRRIASLNVLEVGDSDPQYINASLDLFFDNTEKSKFMFVGYPRYHDSQIDFKLNLFEPQNVVVSVYDLAGRLLNDPERLVIGAGESGQTVVIPNPDFVAGGVLWLVVDFEDWGAIGSAINTVGGGSR